MAAVAAGFATSAGAGSDLRPPSTPSGLTVTGTTSGSVLLSWRKSSDRGTGVAGYRLYLDGSNVGTTKATSYTFGQLSCGRSYTLGVQSYDRAGNRSAIAGIVASTAPCPDTTPPTAPSSLTQIASTQSSVSLAWTASSDNFAVSAYNVYRDGSVVGTIRGTSHTFAGLACGRSYTVGVEAVDAAGNTSPRTSVLAGTSPCPDTLAPVAPTFLVQTAATTSAIALSWAASIDNVGVAGYGVYVNGVRASTTTLTSYSVANLSCGKTYTLGVDAFDAAGNRSPQASVIAATSGCPSTTPPGGTVTFAPAADAHVEEANPSSNFGTSSLRVDGGSDPDVHSYLRFAVSGVSGAVTSAKLRVYATSRTVDGPALYAASADWSENTITWSNRPAVAGPAGDDKASISSGTWIEFDVTGLIASNGAYGFVLLGTSNDGVDLSSREGSAAPQLVLATATVDSDPAPPTTPTVDTTAPTTPTGIAATGITATAVALAWRPSVDEMGVAGYNVFVDGVRSATTSLTTYTFLSLACGRTYTFGVEAYDAAGNVSPRATLSAATAACSPPPASTVCSKTLSAGGDLSTFLASLRPGDVGCLRGGAYTDGAMVTWGVDGTSSSRITLTTYPGEKAELVGTKILLAGDYLTVRDLTIRDVLTVDTDGIAVSGTADRVEHNVVRNVYRQGILLHTSSTNAVIVGNDVREVGQPGSNQDHGIYVQGAGHVVVNNVFAQIRGGYGIHLYSSPSHVTVAQNTVVGSQTRSGILLDTTGGSITVVNNVLVGNADYGMLSRRCDAGGCVVDRNLAWNNRSGAISGSATNTLQADPKFVDDEYHVAAGSLVIDAARGDYSFSPDRDRAPRPLGGGPDLGAYEK